TIREVVSSERGQIRDVLVAAASPSADELGIEIADIRIMRVVLPSEVSSSVFRRMESERARVARDFRSRGAEMAERIRADADRQREVILGNAYRDAELKRGEGDATAADIYAQAYGKDKNFFSFYRSLTAYKQAFKNEGDTLVLEPDSEFFQYFKKSK
ncbi:MAG: protease modulator HflC, partial [Candidatus Methylumidiphilus sp.]